MVNLFARYTTILDTDSKPFRMSHFPNGTDNTTANCYAV